MFLDGLLAFLGRLSPLDWLYYFWPFFVIDFARYVFLDGIVLGRWAYHGPRERRRRAAARATLFRERPLVSVVAPGKNEGAYIGELVDSLARQTYRNVELVVVDDGSDDETPRICRRLKREGKIHQYVRNDPRGGKASAANTALLYAKGEFVVHLDADSNLRFDAIERVILPFYLESDVGAVGGDLRAANPEAGFATRCQALEYIKSISIGRTVSSALGLLHIVSGAFGAFRRDTLERLGGWDVGPGLDGDLAMKLRKLGMKIVHEPNAICFTHVPTTFRGIARQRYRWDRSMVRFRMRKHRDVFWMDWASFSWLNFISSLENVVFSFLLNLKWWVYVAQMVLFHAALVPYLIVVNYVLYMLANLIQYAVASLALRPGLRPADRRLLLVVPLMPPYTGLFLRIVRTFAHGMELLNKASYRDRWNPWKVSRVAQEEGL
ncbi:MAG TPA: glycosyltransferase [Longimicrobiales bacterium]|nr:glycosyltransferase [Longimicrobiales bacterium]